MSTCEQEMCPFWTGFGCICEVADLDPTQVPCAGPACNGECYGEEDEDAE